MVAGHVISTEKSAEDFSNLENENEGGTEVVRVENSLAPIMPAI